MNYPIFELSDSDDDFLTSKETGFLARETLLYLVENPDHTKDIDRQFVRIRSTKSQTLIDLRETLLTYIRTTVGSTPKKGVNSKVIFRS